MVWALPAPLDTLVGQPQRCPAPTLRGCTGQLPTWRQDTPCLVISIIVAASQE